MKTEEIEALIARHDSCATLCAAIAHERALLHRQSASALRFLLQEREWKPIETAVKSSTPIQIANADEIATGRYGAGYDDGGHYREGWTVDGEFWDPQPTHWKPLPALPRRQGDRPELPNDLRSRETNGPQL